VQSSFARSVDLVRRSRARQPVRLSKLADLRRGSDNIHYSALAQINRDQVRRLVVACTYDYGDA
jgi:glucose dehydrogenase